jgi:hypothetical protein
MVIVAFVAGRDDDVANQGHQLVQQTVRQSVPELSRPQLASRLSQANGNG